MTNQPAVPTQQSPWKTWFLRLAALFAGLLLFNLLYTPAISWYRPLSGEAGTVLYAAGFDGFTDEWQQYTGRESAQITNGVLEMHIETSNVVYSAAQPYFADLDVSVTAQATSGSENNAFGIAFRLQQPQQACQLPLQILCDLSASGGIVSTGIQLIFPKSEATTAYYLFLISSDGYYSVWRRTADGGQKISDWIYQEGLIATGLNVENRIRVVGRGDEYQFFVNGTPVALCIPNNPEAISTYYSPLQECIEGSMQTTLTDSSLPTGQIALVVDSINSEPGFTIEFDDLIVISPEDTLVEGDQT